MTLWKTSAQTRQEAEEIERRECPPSRIFSLLQEATNRRHAKRKGRIHEICDVGWSRAKKRAKISGIPFSITKEDVSELLKRQKYACAISGVEFSVAEKSGAYRSPLRPSIDRKVPSEGYVLDNIRLVLVAVNVALSDFGDDVFFRIVESIAERRGWSRPAPL